MIFSHVLFHPTIKIIYIRMIITRKASLITDSANTAQATVFFSLSGGVENRLANETPLSSCSPGLSMNIYATSFLFTANSRIADTFLRADASERGLLVSSAEPASADIPSSWISQT